MGRYCYYCPQMARDWHHIGMPMSTTAYTLRYLEEIYQWCNENTRGRWSYHARTWYRNETNPRFPHHFRYTQPTFLFKDTNDAVLFKLAYGGS